MSLNNTSDIEFVIEVLTSASMTDDVDVIFLNSFVNKIVKLSKPIG